MTSFLERVGVGIVLPLCLLMSFGCADYSPDIDDIHKRLDAMEDNQIATIESQIVSVNSSISNFEGRCGSEGNDREPSEDSGEV